MNAADPISITPAEQAKQDAQAAKVAAKQAADDKAHQKKLRAETPKANDGRERQIGEALGGQEVAAVSYQEDQKGQRHSYVYILEDGTEVKGS